MSWLTPKNLDDAARVLRGIALVLARAAADSSVVRRAGTGEYQRALQAAADLMQAHSERARQTLSDASATGGAAGAQQLAAALQQQLAQAGQQLQGALGPPSGPPVGTPRAAAAAKMGPMQGAGARNPLVGYAFPDTARMVAEQQQLPAAHAPLSAAEEALSQQAGAAIKSIGQGAAQALAAAGRNASQVLPPDQAVKIEAETDRLAAQIDRAAEQPPAQAVQQILGAAGSAVMQQAAAALSSLGQGTAQALEAAGSGASRVLPPEQAAAVQQQTERLATDLYKASVQAPGHKPAHAAAAAAEPSSSAVPAQAPAPAEPHAAAPLQASEGAYIHFDIKAEPLPDQAAHMPSVAYVQFDTVTEVHPASGVAAAVGSTAAEAAAAARQAAAAAEFAAFRAARSEHADTASVCEPSATGASSVGADSAEADAMALAASVSTSRMQQGAASFESQPLQRQQGQQGQQWQQRTNEQQQEEYQRLLAQQRGQQWQPRQQEVPKAEPLTVVAAQPVPPAVDGTASVVQAEVVEVLHTETVQSIAPEQPPAAQTAPMQQQQQQQQQQVPHAAPAQQLHQQQAPEAAAAQQQQEQQAAGPVASQQHVQQLQQAAQQLQQQAEDAAIIQQQRQQREARAAQLEDAPPAPAKRQLRERSVPSTQFGRAMGFAGMGASLIFGSLKDSVANAFSPSATAGGSNGGGSSSGVITQQNAERLANALCRMRGAALKIGQMLSIQDETILPPQIQAALDRVRDGADVMPRRQLEQQLRSQLGPDWQSKVAEFDWEPKAAASIGQVHQARLHDGRVVAMKVQYPGVARSIKSDVDNLMRLISVANLLPRGMYLENAAKVAKRELALECDYKYEAAAQQRYRALIAADPELAAIFNVPDVISELSAGQVLTSEWVHGVTVDKVRHMPQEVRNDVGARLLRLTLKELFDWRYMQTDPNWGNFLFDASSGMLHLIDFGAAKSFQKTFVDDYMRMVKACAERDAPAVVEMSTALGFLTGDESRVMLDAHTEAGFVVGMPFAEPGIYDFAAHKGMTARVSELGSVMLKHRLTPPPDESYSLHRKLSGAFLACMKLRAQVPCHDIFYSAYARHNFGPEDAAHDADAGMAAAEAQAARAATG